MKFIFIQLIISIEFFYPILITMFSLILLKTKIKLKLLNINLLQLILKIQKKFTSSHFPAMFR